MWKTGSPRSFGRPGVSSSVSVALEGKRGAERLRKPFHAVGRSMSCPHHVCVRRIAEGPRAMNDAPAQRLSRRSSQCPFCGGYVQGRAQTFRGACIALRDVMVPHVEDGHRDQEQSVGRARPSPASGSRGT